MIKAIIFDFYGVIRDDEYWNIIKQDRNMTSEFSEMADELNKGKITWSDFLAELSKKTGISVEEILNTLNAEKINTELLKYIGGLHAKYKTAILSNAAGDWFDESAKRIGLDHLFDYIAVSSKVGMVKPDPNFYKHVLTKLGVESNEAIYIDDISRYCDAAAALGMKTIYYRDINQFKTQLEKLLADSNN